MTRNIRQDMQDYLPRYYSDSKNADAIISPEAKEFERLHKAIVDVLDQFFIDTSTWGLARLEKISGVQTDYTKPVEQRRDVLRSKRRGIGTVNADIIESVAAAYSNGEVSVEEVPAEYLVIVTFIGTRGIPEDIEGLKNAIREVLPAHLGVVYKFTYLAWDELEAKAPELTWADVFDLDMTWEEFEKWHPETAIYASVGLTGAEQ